VMIKAMQMTVIKVMIKAMQMIKATMKNRLAAQSTIESSPFFLF
jgi:hypothetical protein